MKERKLFRRDAGELFEYAALGEFFPGFANDLIVAGSGFAYVGNFGRDLENPMPTVPTCLVVVPPDGSPRVVAEDLYFPNGCAFSTDGKKLIVAETLAGRHMAFTIEPDRSLTHRRVWAQPAPRPADPLNAFADLQYAPDGVCIDADGCLWLRTP